MAFTRVTLGGANAATCIYLLPGSFVSQASYYVGEKSRCSELRVDGGIAAHVPFGEKPKTTPPSTFEARGGRDRFTRRRSPRARCQSHRHWVRVTHQEQAPTSHKLNQHTPPPPPKNLESSDKDTQSEAVSNDPVTRMKSHPLSVSVSVVVFRGRNSSRHSRTRLPG